MGLAVAFATLFIVAAPAHASTSGRGGVPLAVAFDCDRGCTFDTRPVCGTDGEWYQNECLAACSGEVEAADVALCDGEGGARNRGAAQRVGRLPPGRGRPAAAPALAAWGQLAAFWIIHIAG